jgi:hypothetical protein
MFKWHVIYHSKTLDNDYNFSLNLTSIANFLKKLWASKVARVPTSGILGLSSWESQDNMTFGCWPRARHKKYYKREGGGFPQVWAVVNFVNL